MMTQAVQDAGYHSGHENKKVLSIDRLHRSVLRECQERIEALVKRLHFDFFNMVDCEIVQTTARFIGNPL